MQKKFVFALLQVANYPRRIDSVKNFQNVASWSVVCCLWKFWNGMKGSSRAWSAKQSNFSWTSNATKQNPKLYTDNRLDVMIYRSC